MNEGLRQQLMDLCGERYRESAGQVVITPSSERELIEVVRLVRARGDSVHRDLSFDLARLSHVGRVEDQSSTVNASAGAPLSSIEREAEKTGLSLGSLSPHAASLTVGAFLTSGYAGLRAVPCGRVESMALALRAVMPDGKVLGTHPSPRSAAGPDLKALILGGEGRAGLLLSAVLKLVPKAGTSRAAQFSFPESSSLIRSLRAALQDGVSIARARVEKRGGRCLLEVEVAGTPESVEKDFASLGHRVFSRGGRASGQTPEVTGSTDERELSLDDVGAALETGARLTLYRVSVEGAVVVGDTPHGLPLRQPHPFAAPGLMFDALDPGRVLGGTI